MKRARTEMNKVVVIGLDGLEPKIVASLLEAGELPNLARLANEGGFAKVATTTPAQTPVAWSTFATGVNPGGHGIFDFITRDPKNYQINLALNRHERKSAWLPPKAVNLRRGETVWDVLARAGISSNVLRCPCNYPPKLDRGRMLAGMGVPDLRGGMGTGIFYSTVEGIVAREAERVVRLSNPSENRWKTVLIGPRDPKTGTDLTIDLTLAVDRERRSIAIRSSGEPAELVVLEGAWSGWLRVKFKAGALQTIRGLTRFHLVRIEPELELYASPIQFDAEFPLFPSPRIATRKNSSRKSARITRRA